MRQDDALLDEGRWPSSAASERASRLRSYVHQSHPPTVRPTADAGLIITEHEEYPPMLGANTIATVTLLLETGMVPRKTP